MVNHLGLRPGRRFFGRIVGGLRRDHTAKWQQRCPNKPRKSELETGSFHTPATAEPRN
jgi:hypothetical protein